MIDEHRELELPSIVTWGHRLLGVSVGGLMVGGTSVTLFAPELKGRGLDNQALAILVPIWAIGIVGIVLLLIGWIRHPALGTELNLDWLDFEKRPDGQVFGEFTKFLALMTAVLMWLGTLGLLTFPDGATPQWKLGLVFYLVTCYTGLIVYLILLYDKFSHPATTTYLRLLTPLFAFLLVPLTWPLMIVLNCIATPRDYRTDNGAESDELWDEET
jgi:hypothetical protein